MNIFYDFHIHSCLSPCGEEEMTPNNIVRMAKLAGYDAIAVADHNSSKNCPALMKVAEKENIVALPAMELTTAEEIHILCLFPTLEQSLDFDSYVYQKLMKIKNRPEKYGHQWILDEYDQIIGEEEYLLTMATEISIDTVYSLVKDFGGEAIPAHIDRNSFSVFSNLGFWDCSWNFDKVEFSKECNKDEFYLLQPEISSLPYLIHSDAHWLAAIPDPLYPMAVEKKEAEGIFKAIINLNK